MKLPKLHLRDLFWLVLVCALGLGWWAHYRALRQRATVLEEQREKLLQVAAHLGVHWRLHNDVITIQSLPERPTNDGE